MQKVFFFSNRDEFLNIVHNEVFLYPINVTFDFLLKVKKKKKM